MKRNTLLISLLLAVIIALCGCTGNSRARKWGGTATEVLPPGQKLVNVTWKDSNLWVLTRPMVAGETPQEYVFSESSRFGIMNGRVIIRETAAR